MSANIILKGILSLTFNTIAKIVLKKKKKIKRKKEKIKKKKKLSLVF